MEILPQLLVNALITGSIYALASSGLALTYGMMRILNFAHGHLMMISAYFFLYWSTSAGLSELASSGLTLLSVVLLALVAFTVFIYPFLELSYLISFVTTLSLAIILESGASITWGVNVKALSTGDLPLNYLFYGIYITPIQIIIIVSAFIVLTALAIVIHLTALGRRIRALTEHPKGAQAIGINNTLLR
ncbi:MAG: hypothetical protein KDD42_09975, partial [Bdellovibrionales bacterium]|nr:hypothetical protein [Bdellovibrionales bacterium]